MFLLIFQSRLIKNVKVVQYKDKDAESFPEAEIERLIQTAISSVDMRFVPFTEVDIPKELKHDPLVDFAPDVVTGQEDMLKGGSLRSGENEADSSEAITSKSLSGESRKDHAQGEGTSDLLGLIGVSGSASDKHEYSSMTSRDNSRTASSHSSSRFSSEVNSDARTAFRGKKVTAKSVFATRLFRSQFDQLINLERVIFTPSKASRIEEVIIDSHCLQPARGDDPGFVGSSYALFQLQPEVRRWVKEVCLLGLLWLFFLFSLFFL